MEVSERIAHLGGALVLHGVGGSGHPFTHALHHLVGAPVEEENHFVGHRAVFLLRLRADAGTLAALDIEVEACALRHLARHVVAARPHRENALHDFQRVAHRADVGVRTEIARAVVEQLPCDEDAREWLLHRDLHIRIGLVVAQEDVEPRPVFLDEVVLEEQRLRFGRDDDSLEVGDQVEHHPGLRGPLVLCSEVAPDALAEAFGLANVQHLALSALP